MDDDKRLDGAAGLALRAGEAAGRARVDMDHTTDVEAKRCKAALEILEASDRWIGGREFAARLGVDGERDLRRQVIWPLRCRFRLPVLSKPGRSGGYKLRASAEEFREAIRWTDRMGRDFLYIKAILRDESLDVVAGQMVMSFLGGPGADGGGRPRPDADGLTMLIEEEARRGRKVSWTDVVERLLRVMAERPEEYAEPIARIGERYGGMFLPAARVAAIQARLDEVGKLLAVGGVAVSAPDNTP